MTKKMIVINGSGGVGKDTLIEYAGRFYKVRNISSITPVKEAASLVGWKGEKDNKSRKFLSDLKALINGYNGYIFQYILSRYGEFLESGEDILFVHIREPEEIARIRESVPSAVCMLIRTKRNIPAVSGNVSDESVENFEYDYIFDNDGDLETERERFLELMKTIIEVKPCQ